MLNNSSLIKTIISQLEDMVLSEFQFSWPWRLYISGSWCRLCPCSRSSLSPWRGTSDRCCTRYWGRSSSPASWPPGWPPGPRDTSPQGSSCVVTDKDWVDAGVYFHKYSSFWQYDLLACNKAICSTWLAVCLQVRRNKENSFEHIKCIKRWWQLGKVSWQEYLLV